MEYEDVLDKIEPFGAFQKRLCAIMFLAGIPNAFPSIMFAYTQYIPDFHCTLPHIQAHAKNTSSYEQLLNSSLPWKLQINGKFERSQCEMYEERYNETDNSSTTHIVPCKFGRTFSTGNTLIAEFDLVCENAWKAPFAVTLYMIGMGLAAVSGKVSDRFGRRPVFLFFTFAQFLAAGLLGFSWNFPSYAALALLVGFSGMVNYVAAFVLVTETMGVRRQTSMAIFCVGSYSVGIIISPILGYLFPYWRWFLWSTSLIGPLYIPLYWLCPESLRWTLVSGRKKQAIALLEKIADTNGKKIDADQVYRDFQEAKARSAKMAEIRLKKEGIDISQESSYLHMLRNKAMLIRSSALYLGWCVSSMLYFAITLNPSTLVGDRLVNICLSGLVELPAFALSYCLIRWTGRVRGSVFFYTVAGISCCIAPFVTGTAVTVLVLIGKACITAVFNIVYLVVAEITPTLVRTTSLGVASTSARVGAIIMPYLMFAGQEVSKILPFMVMGGLSLVAGLVTTLFIPETRGVSMPDTIKDALENQRIYGLNLCKTFEEDKTEGNEEDTEKLNPNA